MTTILTIEKETCSRKMLNDNLVQNEYKLLWAENLEQGLALALRHGPDIVLLNYAFTHQPKVALEQKNKLQGLIKANGGSMILLVDPLKDLLTFESTDPDIDFLTLPVAKDQLLARLNTHLQITRLRRELKECQARLSGILYHEHIGIAYADKHYRLNNINDQFTALFGYPEQSEVALLDILVDDQLNSVQLKEKIEVAVTAHDFFCSELQIRHQNDLLRWCKIRASLIVPGKLEQGIVWCFEDITEQKLTEDELQLAATVYKVTGEAIVVLDDQYHLVSVNPAFSAITGFQEADIHNKPFFDLIEFDANLSGYEDFNAELKLHGKWRGELKIKRLSKNSFFAYLRIDAVTRTDGSISQYVCVLSDFTERKRFEEELRFQAEYDALTQLPNRNLFLHRLHLALTGAKRYQHSVALLYIDLDHFKSVNDYLGHGRGDEVLLEVAQRLKQHVREVDTVARLGGDEFVIILNGTSNKLIESTVQRVLKSLNLRVKNQKVDFYVTASIGIAMYPEDCQGAEKLVLLADQAMYKAKQTGKATFCWHSIKS